MSKWSNACANCGGNGDCAFQFDDEVEECSLVQEYNEEGGEE